jgi:hypothetical protein
MSSYLSSWLFTKEELETIVTRDGISLEQDFDYRKSTCAFMQEVGMMLKVPQLTIATAWVYFHRFYVLHSFKEYDRFVRTKKINSKDGKKKFF